MFVLGTALRDARQRRGLELEEVEEQTRISRRYLRALEEERFELLPGDAYATAFLRSYAEFLGLDGKAFADEYRTRSGERALEPAPAFRPMPRRRRSAVASLRRWPLLAGLAVAALVGVLAWQYGSPGSPTPVTRPTPPPVAAPSARISPPTRPRQKQIIKAPIPVLLLKAAGGACWIDVHLWSAKGKVIYTNTLAQGATVRFSLRRPLWLRLGAPSAVQVTIAGKPITGLPTQASNFLATKTGIRPA